MGQPLVMWLLLSPLVGPAAESGPAHLSPAILSDEPDAELTKTRSNRFVATATGVVLINQSLSLYDLHVRPGVDREQFRVGWDTFRDNLERGFEWDDNTFWTNQFYHPGHGSLHFAVARANGYDYWQSAAWTLAGSWLWEHTGETNPPSVNDLINSTLGGAALGEPLYRLSNVVLDNRATGIERAYREIAGFVVSPGNGVGRLVTGDMFRVHHNPADRVPAHLRNDVRVGYRSLADVSGRTPGGDTRFAEADIRYGSPFERSSRAPLGSFDLDVVCNLDDPSHIVGVVTVTGLVWGRVHGAAARHVVGLFQHFDYYDNPAYMYGTQSIGAGYLGRMPVAGSVEIRPAAHLNGVLLGAMGRDFPGPSGRNYDYGMGWGYDVTVSLARPGASDIVTLSRGTTLVWAIDGGAASHRVSTTTVSVRHPLAGPVALGGHYTRYAGAREYDGNRGVAARADEYRAYLAWVIN